VLTTIEDVVSPVLHIKVPVAFVDNVDGPSQTFATTTTGVGGKLLGNASVDVEGALVHPLTVVVAV